MQDQFAEFVKRIEADADRNMTLYKLKLMLLAMLGYAYIFWILAVLLVLVGLILWAIVSGKGLNSLVIRIEIVLLIFTSVVVRSLWVRVPAPKGIELEQRQAPELFATVDEIRRAVDGPTVHVILIDDEFNARVVSVPRLGLFGWPRNYLVVGLPMLHAMSAIELRAVLAHELGHLAGAHGRFASWIYRIRMTWNQLMMALAARGGAGAPLFNRFFRWYVPYFQSYSFVLARRHEYEADLCATEIASARTTADTLIKCEIYSWFLIEKFWEELWDLAKSQNSPPHPYSDMAVRMRTVIPADDGNRWLQSGLERKTASWDTHPSLKDRLSALGQEPQLPPPITESAAEVYFGAELNALAEQLNVEWQEEYLADWKEEHERFQVINQELGELNARAGNASLTAEEMYKRAYFIEADGNRELAIQSYREALDLDKDHTGSNLALGRLLLSDDKPEGIPFLERAIDLQATGAVEGCYLMASYFEKQGDTVAAHRYWRRSSELERIGRIAWTERHQVSFIDRFMSHDLPDHEVERLRSELAKNRRVREAYLVRKELKHKPEIPLYTLGLVFDQRWFKKSEDDSTFAEELPEKLKTSWELFSFVLDVRNSRFRNTLRKIPNSLIYQRQP